MAEIQENRKVGYRINGNFTISPNEGYDAFKQATIYTNIYNYLDATDVTLPYVSMTYYNGVVIPQSLHNWENLADGTDFFHYAYYIKEVDLKLEKLENATYMFANCTALISAKLGNTTNLTNAFYMFAYCTNLTDIEIDTSNVTNMMGMFSNCTKLTTFPSIDTSNVTDMYGMFNRCSSLTDVPLLDTPNVTKIDSIFYDCPNLTNLGGFKNLAVRLVLNSCPLLTVESLMNVINNLKDLTGGTTQRLVLGSTNLAKLTDEQKAIATNKNWVLA